MENKELTAIVERLFKAAEKLIPAYIQNEQDERIANRNVAACIIDAQGGVYGKMFGTNKVRARESYKLAWTKASQVWITGLKTGEFEKKAFNNELDEAAYGIERPDYIGWEGGQPLILKDGTILAAGFSGFRGITDLEIMIKALEEVNKHI